MRDEREGWDEIRRNGWDEMEWVRWGGK